MSTSTAGESYAFAYAAWVIVMVATLGSLFFGEVMKLPPCTLCWYQRICLFPLAVLLPAGILLRDGNLSWYALPLTVAGLGIALYHNLVYYGVVPEDLAPCTQGVSCSDRQIDWLGFVSIPSMSLVAFLAILVFLLAHRSRLRSART